MTKCDKCQMPAIIYQKYSGMHLCQAHFDDDVQRKVRESLRQTGLFGRGARVALALDGGKESATLAFILKNLFKPRRDIDLVAIIVDEGGPHTESMKSARLAAERLEITSIVKCVPALHLPGLGGQDAFSGCRIGSDPKMEHFISLAQEIDADIIATGHNLDDEATDVFMRYLRGDVDELLALRPGNIRAGRIPWIKPLRRIPAKETRLYALRHHLCYSGSAEEDALRREARRQLSGFDSRHPGTKYSLLRSLEKICPGQSE